MAHDQETRQAVRNAYVFDRLDLGAAADKHSVSRGTAQRWKNQAAAAGDDWDNARSAASISANGTRMVAEIVLSDFMQAYQKTMELLNDPETNISAKDRVDYISKMADAFTKTMSAVAKAAPELGQYAVANELMHHLTRFVSENYPQHLEAVLEIMEPFAIEVANEYGG